MILQNTPEWFWYFLAGYLVLIMLFLFVFTVKIWKEK